MSNNNSKQNVVIINSSHFVSGNANNKYVYQFQPGFSFSSNDRIGVQSLSIFNSFYNISAAQINNKLTINYPCFNPATGSSAVFQGSIGNAVQFQGQITNPSNIEITGSTITQMSTFTGFIAGTKVNIASGYVTGSTLIISNGGTPALATNMYIGGTTVQITGGNNSTGWTLSSSSLSGTTGYGSAASPSTTIFACPSGNKLYVTSTATAALSGTIYVKALSLTSTQITATSLTISAGQVLTFSFPNSVYYGSRQFTAGVGTTTFVGFSSGTIYNGMTFSYTPSFSTATTYTIQTNSLSGSTYTLTLNAVAGVFPSETIQNVSLPNTVSILTVSDTTIGSGIYLSGGSIMYLSGAGIGNNVIIQGQISSAGTLTGVQGVYQISYSPNTEVITMVASDNVTVNTNLYVTSVQSGTITLGMKFQLNGAYIQITGQPTGVAGSTGRYTISTPAANSIPSIYPTQFSAASTFSNIISLDVTIPDGFYDAASLNFFLQNTMLANNMYISDSTNSSIATFYLEVVQNQTYYGLQINLYPLPTKLSTTQTYPAGAAWTLLSDGNKYTPQIILPAGLQKWFGFSPNSINKYPLFSYDSTASLLYIPSATNSLQNTPLSFYINAALYNAPVQCFTFISDVCPVLHTVSALVIDCNLINSKYNSDRSNIFYSVPISNSFGNLITVGPFPPCLCNIYSGIYDSIVLSFYDTLGNPVNIRDSDATISLVLSIENDIHPHRSTIGM